MFSTHHPLDDDMFGGVGFDRMSKMSGLIFTNSELGVTQFLPETKILLLQILASEATRITKQYDSTYGVIRQINNSTRTLIRNQFGDHDTKLHRCQCRRRYTRFGIGEAYGK